MEDNRIEEEKINKIKSIVEREIEQELIKKQNEVSEISEKIKNVLRNLELLKYVIAVGYYDQNPVLISKKNQDEANEDDKQQNQIHPCTKKLLPFRTNYEKSLGSGISGHVYDTRKSKKIAINNFTVTTEIKKEIEDETEDKKKCDVSDNIKIPRYIPPLPNKEDLINNVNSTGGNASKERFRLVVGNVSKFISPDSREDNSTYKWMMYIRNKEEGLDIKKHLKKVRYFLHESYKPHDIIDVTAPFQLTRRGWGEFPIRVQLHFIHPLNKPIDIIHNLKLDMTCSGVQMLGAETVVDISLYTNDIVVPPDDAKKPIKQEENEDVEKGQKEKQDIFDDSLLMSINGIKMNDASGDGIENHLFMQTIKEEPEDDEPCDNDGFVNHKIGEMELALCNSRKFLLDRRKALKIIEIEHNYTSSQEVVKTWDQSINDFAKSILKLDSARNDKSERKNLKNGYFHSNQIGQLLEKKDRLCGLDFFANHSNEEEIFQKLKCAARKMETETQSKYCLKAFRHAYLVNVLQRAQATQLKSVEALIRWFVQRWPVVTKLSSDPAYKMIHPYSCSTDMEFFRYSVGKQRSAEWFRAKAIQKVLKTLKSIIPIEEEIWTTKQILLWCRFHGYFPISSSSLLSGSTSTTTYSSSCPSSSSSSSYPIKCEPTEASDSKIRTGVRGNDSSSDSEDGSDKFSEVASSSKMENSYYLNGLSVVEKKKNFKKSRKKDFEGEENLEKNIDYTKFNSYTEEQCDSMRFGYNEFRTLQAEEDLMVDVVEVENEVANECSANKKKELSLRVETTPPGQSVFVQFVCDSARRIGAKITEEEIVPGVLCDSVARVLTQSVSCFVEELVRRSWAQAWIRNNDRYPDSLELNDILGTLIEHPRFDIFTNRGLGQQMPESSNS